MARLTLSDFQQQFASVIHPEDRLVVVYSGIWSFGHRFDVEPQVLPEALLESIQEVVGPTRTLLLPAYTYDYTQSRRYSPTLSLPQTGVLPVAMLKHFTCERTKSALSSFLAIGPDATNLAGIVGETIWGDDSLIAHLERAHARMVVLGLPWKDACGFLHRIEEACHVPYRYYKTFHGMWEEEPWVETMFVRPLTCMTNYRWNMVDELLRSRSLVFSNTGEIHIESANAADIVAAGSDILGDDPYRLLVNADEVRHWVKIAKSAEISELRRMEPRATIYMDKYADK
jgi:aminoglycoside N3'-acetyltransferase